MYKLLNAKQAAKLLGVSTNTIRNWSKRGVVKSIQVGTVHYYSDDSLKKLVKDLERNKDLSEYNSVVNKSLIESKELNRKLKYELKFGKFRVLLINTLRGIYYIEDIDLTNKELEIVNCILDLESYQEIAERYGCTEQAIGYVAKKAFMKISRAKNIKDKIAKLEERNKQLEKENNELQLKLNTMLDIANIDDISKEELGISDDLYEVMTNEIEEPRKDGKVLRVLKRMNISTIGQLASISELEIKRISGIGDGTVKKISTYLSKYNLSLENKQAKLMYMNKFDQKKNKFID